MMVGRSPLAGAVQDVINKLDAAVPQIHDMTGPLSIDLAEIRTALIALRDEPPEA